MGNSQQKNTQTQKFYSRLEPLNSNTQLSTTIMIDKLTKIPYFQKQLIFISSQLIRKQFSKLQNKQQILIHPNVIPITDIIVHTQNMYCSTNHKILLYSQYYHWNLHQQIHLRKKQNRIFTITQLWHILESCIYAMSHFEKKSIYYQTMRSQKIYCSQDLSKIKLCDPYIQSTSSNYQQAFSSSYQQNIYLSPEQLQAKKNNCRLEPLNIDSFKSDLFSLGMIMVELSLLQNQFKCYNNDNFLYDILSEKIDCIQKIYGKQFSFFIKKMLIRDPQQRSQWIFLEKQMKIFKDNSVENLHIGPLSLRNQQLKRKNQISNYKLESVKINCMPYSQYRKFLYNSKVAISQKVGEIQNHFDIDDTKENIQQIQSKYTIQNIQSLLNFKKSKIKQVGRLSPKKPILILKQYMIDLKKQNLRITQQEPIQITHQTIQTIADQYQQTSIKIIPDNFTYLNQINSHQTNLRTQLLSSQYEQFQQVIQIFKHGSRYQGQKIRGMRHGSGKFYYQDGGFYQGQWKQNRMSGYGKLFYKSGKLAYEGLWQSDKFQGFGILYNQYPQNIPEGFNYKNFEQVEDFWVRFQGEFHNDIKEGVGKLYLSNNEKFQGSFEDDLVNGRGVYYRYNGQIIRGSWKQNYFIDEDQE